MPMVLSGDEWGRITKWTKKPSVQVEVAQRSEHIRSLDERSRAISRKWPDSIENIAKQHEEMRLERKAAEEEANAEFYRDYVKRRRQEQEQLMESARDTFFKTKDAPKLLVSAVIETATLKERQEQIQFLNQLRQETRERKKRDDNTAIEHSRAFHKFHVEKARRRREANKAYQEELLQQLSKLIVDYFKEKSDWIHETSERQRREYEDELNNQKVDSMRAAEEIEIIEKFERDLRVKEKRRILADAEQSLKDTEERRRARAAQQRLEDQITEVLTKSKQIINAKRRETEREIQEEKLRVLEGISRSLKTGEDARDAQEQANLAKAIREKQEADDARLAADRRKKEDNKAARIAVHEQYLKEEAKRQLDFENMKTWEMMNRFKNAELYREYKEDLLKEKKRKAQEYRAEILEQQRERKEKEDKERADRQHFYGELAEQRLRREDDQGLRYGAALLEEARAHTPEHPIHRAIDRYCKKYRLYPMPPLPKPLQRSFPHYKPVDKSRPDPPHQPVQIHLTNIESVFLAYGTLCEGIHD
ncbi:hypothetical protein EVAR_94947_1 [Eumeta japonica]|uniref:Trichohyalin-plectin-homology domain-containing protein n=1 Tax=Eumeta variegata TaxID=151549 RepID=A0A4C1UWC7_EUMVA|nr:hypothetical protein EVAR_94947_1 [Eumeta japonica]